MCKMMSMILAAAMLLGTGPAVIAQEVRTIDPNQAIDADLSAPRQRVAPPSQPDQAPTYSDDPRFPSSQQEPAPYPPQDSSAQPYPADPYAPPADPAQQAIRADAKAEISNGNTFKREEILSAAEGTFGKGTAGLAGFVEKILKEQGEPNAYIAGSEASGAIVLGLRYGKGQLFHKVEGQQKIYWTGPSVGFDLGGDGNKVFALVYNLYDSEDLYKRFPAGEGRLYFVGGLAATYLRRGNTVVIPIRLGVGWRQGVNLGYMKFSHKSKWFPL